MRSVFVFTAADRSAIENALDAMGEHQPGQWVVDGVLFVHIEEPPNWSDGWGQEQVDRIIAAIGRTPPRLVVADVSGRVPGQQEARRIASTVLHLGLGVAVDDYSPHLWTPEEIDGDEQVDDRRFFEPRPGSP